jgi:hypothetical protein
MGIAALEKTGLRASQLNLVPIGVLAQGLVFYPHEGMHPGRPETGNACTCTAPWRAECCGPWLRESTFESIPRCRKLSHRKIASAGRAPEDWTERSTFRHSMGYASYKPPTSAA